MEILKVEDLTFGYPTEDKNAIEKISFTVDKGQFVTVCGSTGSGKSTLLRLLKSDVTFKGSKKGAVWVNNMPLDKLSEKENACLIGYVMQKPQHQIVTDKVWHELAFGLENLNFSRADISSRIAEVASYFGIENWYYKNTCDLSGGQKQILNLASVMVMNPEILILDEPTAQLDPITASDFIATIKKLNRDFGLTVIIAEHRLEEVVPISDKVIVLDDGKVAFCGKPKEVIGSIPAESEVLYSMPMSARIFKKLKGKGEVPLSISSGKRYVENTFSNNIKSLKKTLYHNEKSKALEMKNVYFRYCKNGEDVLSDLNLTVYENEIYCLLGGNGTGKTTTLGVASDLLKPYTGKIKVFNKEFKGYKGQSLYSNCLSCLPQDIQTVFLKNTVEEELADGKVCSDTLPFDLSYLYKKHPYDISGGEQQLVALAKVLATKPRLLLLDEPTKGIDAYSKNKLAEILKNIKEKGTTILIVTHDLEFASICADRCGLFFKGQLVSEDVTEKFFSKNNFYTTAVSRITRGYYEDIVTIDDLVKICTLNNGSDDKCI